MDYHLDWLYAALRCARDDLEPTQRVRRSVDDFPKPEVLGSPVDFVVFYGLDDGQQVTEVVFVEVKPGKSRLSAREKLVKEAVEAKRVRYWEMRLPGRVQEIGQVPSIGSLPADGRSELP